MITTSVYNTSQAYSLASQSAQGDDTLGKEDFLKLLVLQMQNQDPLDPVKNEDFIAQLAQFNSLEQMQNLNATMSTMSSLQTLADTSGLIGKKVQFLQDGSTIAGAVTAVKFTDGAASIVVSASGKNYTITADSIVSVYQ